MEAVDEIEGKSDQNGDCNQQSAQVHLARPLIMSLRSKPLSVPFSGAIFQP